MAITTPVQAFKQNPQVRERTQQVLQQAVQQRPDLSPELLKDQAKISDEFMDEVGKIGETQGYDPGMLSALAGNFLEQKTRQNPESDEAKPVDAKKKGPKKTTEAKWEPQVRSGEVIPPQGKIGEVTTKTTTEPNDEEKKDGKKADKAKGPSKVQAPRGAAGSQKGSGAPDAPKDEEKVEFSQETKEMLNKMHAQGMQTPGNSQEAKPAGGVSEKTDEVFMPSQGLTQA
ncbi:MAG: hypothetical protein KIS61_34550, partial [Candidatus Eremiobacteraeota bacterium]|nr:hypothetical protein [Candidatus Eremiobacteraeota bacterium]